MSIADALRATALLVVSALVQVVILSSLSVAGGTPDLALVMVVSLGLVRGALAGALAGFVTGIVVDLAALDTLGLTSLVLTLVGYWAGRYAETSARGRRLPVLVAVGSLTVLAAVFSALLRALLGEEVVVERALLTALAPALALNLALALPIVALVRTLLPPRPAGSAPEVELVA